MIIAVNNFVKQKKIHFCGFLIFIFSRKFCNKTKIPQNSENHHQSHPGQCALKIKAYSFSICLRGRWHECALNDRMLIIHLPTVLCHCSGDYCANTNVSRIIIECPQVIYLLSQSISSLSIYKQACKLVKFGRGLFKNVVFGRSSFSFHRQNICVH